MSQIKVYPYFLQYSLVGMILGKKIHTNVQSNCNLRENYGSEGHNILRSVNEFVSLLYIFIVVYR